MNLSSTMSEFGRAAESTLRESVRPHLSRCSSPLVRIWRFPRLPGGPGNCDGAPVSSGLLGSAGALSSSLGLHRRQSAGTFRPMANRTARYSFNSHHGH